MALIFRYFLWFVAILPFITAIITAMPDLGDTNVDMDLLKSDPANSMSIAEDRVIIDFVGFVSSVIGIFSFFQTLLSPTPDPKVTLDTVVKKLDEEFQQVNAKLSELLKKTTQLQISQYHSFEKALFGAINDMKYKEKDPATLNSRALTLFDELQSFMKGMLGQSNTAVDLIKAVMELQNVCISVGFLFNKK